jgi:Phycobilisome degradation protein nblA
MDICVGKGLGFSWAFPHEVKNQVDSSKLVSSSFIRNRLKLYTCQVGVMFVNLNPKSIDKIDVAKNWRVEIMDIPMELNLEQKFNLKLYEDQVKELSHEESQKFLLEVLRQLMVKDNMIKHLLKEF